MSTAKITFLLFIGFGLLFISCSEDEDIAPTPTNTTRQFGIFTVQEDDTTVSMNGDIGSSSLNNFNSLLMAFPNVNKINIVECGGSTDDEVNLQLSARVHQKNIDIHLLDNGLIASGGVDFFLAGINRTKGTNTMIGVHSWGGPGGVQATDFPVGHAEHLSYINYYVSIGFTQQQAENFYYFTINAASADDIHYMTDAEIAQYNILTESNNTNNVTITAGDDFTDSRDGTVYPTIKINNQTWMTKNLSFNVSGESFAYNNNESNVTNYGRLYTWGALQQAIPAGWHLPTDAEWQTLESALGMNATDLVKNDYDASRTSGTVGTKLKAGGDAMLNFPMAGFAVIDNGNTDFEALENRTYLWVNTTTNGEVFRRRIVKATSETGVYRFANPSDGFAISVRLVKD